MPADVRIDLETIETEERIDLRVFTRALDAVRTILGELDHAIAGGKFRWNLIHLEVGSGIFVARGEWMSVDDQVEAQENPEYSAIENRIVTRFVEGLASLDAGPIWPEAYSAEALRAASELASLRRDEVVEIKVTSPNTMVSVAITERVRANVHELIGPALTEMGSIEGLLQRISLVGKQPEFWVRDSVSGELVPCPFSAASLSSVREAIGRRVQVTGELTYSRRGEIKRFRRMESLRVLEDLPVSITDVVGIARGLTEGLSSDEYIRTRW